MVKEKIWNRAKKTVNDNSKLRNLIDAVDRRTKKYFADTENQEGFTKNVSTFSRMVKAYIGGNYRAFSTQTILLIVFSLVYFITPTDLIPDFLPALGFTDDIAIIYYIFNRISSDIESFKDWEIESKEL